MFTGDPDELEGCDDGADYDIEEVGGGFRTRCSVPDSLYGVIIGPKGGTKKRLEVETSAKIVIPRMGEKGDIVVRGVKREDVVQARRRIELIASQARFRREPTHFLCFPLKSPNIVQGVREFQDKVLKDFKGQNLGIDEKVFQEAGKMHLTLCVLFVLDQGERKAVADKLEELKPEFMKVVSKGNLRIRLQGLEIMNDDPTQVNILFAKCVFSDDESKSMIQSLSDLIYKSFLKTGYGKSSRSEAVKLHATLMNTRYRQQDANPNEGGNGANHRGPRFDKEKDNFNAKLLLEKYGDYDFGFVEIKEVHISTRHTKGPDGFYKASAKISLMD